MLNPSYSSSGGKTLNYSRLTCAAIVASDGRPSANAYLRDREHTRVEQYPGPFDVSRALLKVVHEIAFG